MLSFTPHLIPQKRGILSTIYINLNKPCTTEEIVNLYKEYYKDEFFVRVKDAGKLPGQAVQNMNLLFGLEETTGLKHAGFYL